MADAAHAPTLTDGTVTLRAGRKDDAQRCLEQCQDPESQTWTTVPVPYSIEMAEEFVTELMAAGWADDSAWTFAIEVDGAFAGSCALRNDGDGVAEVAYGAHPAVRGTGVMQRAVRLLVDWGFAERGLQTIVWRANIGNWASRKLAWRLGFTVEGTVRRVLPQRGTLYDAWVGTLLRDDPREPATTWLDCPVLDVGGAVEGLRLRPTGAGDIDRIQQACTDERTQRWLGQLPSPYTRHDAVEYVESRTEQRATGAGVTWAVTWPESRGDELLATVSWFNWRPGVECEIGYWAHPDARGRGLIAATVTAVVDHVFETLDLERVTLFAAVENTASCHVAEACGFRRYGVERYGAHVRDAWVDMALYDVTAAEWGSRRAATASTAKPASDSTTPTSSGDR